MREHPSVMGVRIRLDFKVPRIKRAQVRRPLKLVRVRRLDGGRHRWIRIHGHLFFFTQARIAWPRIRPLAGQRKGNSGLLHDHIVHPDPTIALEPETTFTQISEE